MPGLDLSSMSEGIVLAALGGDSRLIVIIQGAHGGRIYGRTLDGHCPVEFDADTGQETIVRRDLPKPTPDDANPRFLASLRGDWAEGLHVISSARLPDDLAEAIMELDAMVEESGHRRRDELMKENADLVRQVVGILEPGRE